MLRANFTDIVFKYFSLWCPTYYINFSSIEIGEYFIINTLKIIVTSNLFKQYGIMGNLYFLVQRSSQIKRYYFLKFQNVPKLYFSWRFHQLNSCWFFSCCFHASFVPSFGNNFLHNITSMIIHGNSTAVVIAKKDLYLEVWAPFTSVVVRANLARKLKLLAEITSETLWYAVIIRSRLLRSSLEFKDGSNFVYKNSALFFLDG